MKIINLFMGTAMIVAVTFFYSCQSDNGGIVFGQQESQVTNTGLELPAHVAHCLTLTHTINLNGKDVVNYTTEYDTINYVPRWVAFKFYKDINVKNVERTDDGFHNDPSLPRRFQFADNVHFTPYQRGHMCASADRTVSSTANEQTFYFTNMSPQLGDFNVNIWAALESQVRTWRERYDTLYVVRGGILSTNKTITVSGKKMNVPSKYWMALLGRKGDNFSAIAFCLDHKAYGGDQKFSTHAATISNAALSIDSLETLTGIDLFPSLPDNLETAVESQLTKAAWYGLKE